MNSFRLNHRLTLLLTLLIGLGLAASAHAIPDRKGWQNLKKKYDVKQGLAKVNMGKAFDNFDKAFTKNQKKDPKAVLKALDKLEKDLDTYTAAAKKAKVDKGFLGELAGIDKQIKQMRDIFESRTDPFKIVKKRLAAAMSGYKKLKPDSPGDDFKQYYKEDFRLIGMALKDLIAKEPDFKGVAGDFFKNANPVNANVQKLLKEDPKDTAYKENMEKNATLKTGPLKDIRAALGKVHAVIKKF